MFILSSISPLNMVPVIGDPPVEVYSEPPPILLPVSTVPAMPRQVASVGRPGLDSPELGTPPMVSIIMLTIVVVTYCALTRCLRTPLSSKVLAMSTCHMRRLLWLRM